MRRSVRLALLVAATLSVSPVIAAPTDDKQAILDRGIAEKNKQDLDAAIADFGNAIAVDPKWAVPYEFRGASYAAKFETSDAADPSLIDKAIDDYDTVIRLGAATARTFTLRGIALSDRDDTKGALADFDHALKLDATFEMAKQARDFVLAQRAERDRSIVIDGQLLEFQPRNIDLLLNHAMLLARADRRDEALKDLAKVLEIDPKNEAALAERAALEKAGGPAEP